MIKDMLKTPYLDTVLRMDFILVLEERYGDKEKIKGYQKRTYKRKEE